MALRRSKNVPELSVPNVVSVRSQALTRQVPDPLQSGGHLPLAAGRPLREACWDRLPPDVVTRMEATAGDPIEWWASGLSAHVPVNDVDGHPERPRAALIGVNGACFAIPRIDSNHRPLYALTHYVLDPATHRRAEVIAQPGPQEEPVVPGEGLVAAPPALVSGLTDAAEELLSNLPVRAQKMVLAPFGEQQPVRDCEWHYEGTGLRFSMFAVAVVGAKDLCLAHGSRVIPIDHTERTAHWSLVCRRAGVLRSFDERLTG
jgi:hypothetical protein